MKNYTISLPVSSLQKAVAYSSNLTSITNGVGLFDGSSITSFYDLRLTYSGASSSNFPGQQTPLVDYAYNQANTATALAQAAFNKANTGGGGGGGTTVTSNPANGITTTVGVSSTDLSLTTIGNQITVSTDPWQIPRLTIDKFGRVINASNAAAYTGFMANSVIYADTTGKLANNAVFQYKTSSNTLYTPNVTVSNRLDMGNNSNISVFFMQFNPVANAMDFIFTF